MRCLVFPQCVLVLLLSPLNPAQGEITASFDWRDVGGQNYITPVRNQGSVDTCWAFSAVAALEAKFNMDAGKSLDLDLSEQHLLCAGGMGDLTGGYEYLANSYFESDGITAEATLPYTALNTSPNWPIVGPYTVYKTTSVQNWISNDTSSVKAALRADGPLIAAMNSETDWFVPPSGSAVGNNNSITDTLGASCPMGDPLGGSINHAICVVGWYDDNAVSSGGYWVVKNSWGTDWGDDGYGYIKYGVLEHWNRIHAITGSTFTEEKMGVPEPAGGVVWLFCGLAIACWQRKTRPASCNAPSDASSVGPERPLS